MVTPLYPAFHYFSFFNPWKTGAQMPNKITRWEPRLARNLAVDISTTWLHHYILLSTIILFWTLNPWKTGTQMPKKITRWYPRWPRIMAADISTKWLHHYILLSIIILFWTLNPWKTGAQMPKKITRWYSRLPKIMAADISTKWLLLINGHLFVQHLLMKMVVINHTLLNLQLSVLRSLNGCQEQIKMG